MKTLLAVILILSTTQVEAAWKCIKQKDASGKTVAVTCGKSQLIELTVKQECIKSPPTVEAPVVKVAPLPAEETKGNGSVGVDANGNTFFK